MWGGITRFTYYLKSLPEKWEGAVLVRRSWNSSADSTVQLEGSSDWATMIFRIRWCISSADNYMLNLILWSWPTAWCSWPKEAAVRSLIWAV